MTKYSYPAQELATLATWEQNNTFRETLSASASKTPFVFYDGPPFANGLPHYGHLLTGFVKDVVPRYKTMRGFHVERVFGWDCHGLPAELEAMKQLKLKTTGEVQELGLEAFNERCREAVLQYTREWETTVTRQARWVDFAGGYKTLEPSFMESCLWAFKELYTKGLVYSDYKVLPYCLHDETPLSSHELTMDGDTYQEREDLSVTVALPLHAPADSLLHNASVLVWTTTPWTLPSNLLVAVSPTLSYAVMEDSSGKRVVLAETALSAYTSSLENYTLLGVVTGEVLMNMPYTPPFPFYKDHEGAHRVVTASWVEAETGTGAVHVAPGFGEVDKELADAHQVKAVVPLTPSGHFTTPVTSFEGLQVFEANEKVVETLRSEVSPVSPGVRLFKEELYKHSYPHCWRCRNPLVYRGVDSWFVKTTAFKDRMLELAKEVTWVPEASGRLFNNWLENVRDWAVSRNRFWGSPVPVWVSDNPTYPRTDVYGSLEELEQDFGWLPRNSKGEVDLHRPYVDDLVRPNPDDPTGKSMMRRVPEVLDVWFDSGAMSFAQHHYPFEHKEEFEASFPADFVVEYTAQTRGWFYTLHVLSAALFDKPAFKTCLSHGVVLGSDGLKMSKSRRNYPPVDEVFDTFGADAMRWYLLASPVLSGGNLVVSEEGLALTVNNVLNPLVHAHKWVLQGVKETVNTREAPSLLTRWVESEWALFLKKYTDAMDKHDFAQACELARLFLDSFTNWYVRASRPLLDEEETASEVYATARNVLGKLDVVLAPLLPYTTEYLWKELGNLASVHLEDWPQGGEVDEVLNQTMAQVREVVSAASALRKKAGVPHRQPLSTATLASNDSETLQPFESLLLSQLNVKTLTLTGVLPLAKPRVKVDPRKVGPMLGQKTKEVLVAVREGAWTLTPEGLQVAEVLLPSDCFTLLPSELPTNSAKTSAGVVTLDFTLTPALEKEGFYRELQRAVQVYRKDSKRKVGELVELHVEVAPEHFLLAETLRARLERTTTTLVKFSEGSETRVFSLGN